MLLDEWEFGGGINGRTGIVARLQANTYLKLLICNLILSPTLETQAFPFVGGRGAGLSRGYSARTYFAEVLDHEIFKQSPNGTEEFTCE